MTIQASFFNIYILYIYNILLILIVPSTLDDSIVDFKLNKLLFNSEEAIELLKDYQINDLLRPLSDFTSISVVIHSGRS